MSEQIEPVAEVPEASSLVAEEQSVNAEVTDEKAAKSPLSKKQWPWFVVAGVAVVTGLAGFALGHGTNDGNHEFRSDVQNGQGMDGRNGGNRGIDPDGDNWNGGGKQGQPGFGQPGQGQPGQLPGQLPGQMQPGMPGANGQPGFGPHCENTTGSHAPVNADGSCPTGFTLDNKGAGAPGVAPGAPKATPSTSASPTS